MPRKAVSFVNGEIYHIYNRGVDKRAIFLDKNDYLRFYQTMYLFNTIEPIINFSHARASASEKTLNRLVKIHAYSLLPNHYHMLIEQINEDGISDFVKRISGGYTSYFNEKYDRTGVLFQGRFKRVYVATDEQYRYLFSYVNENHSVHKILRPEEICYSSSLFYQGNQASKVVDLRVAYNANESQELAKEIFRKRHNDQIILE